MKRAMIGLAAFGAALGLASVPAAAESGHFISGEGGAGPQATPTNGQFVFTITTDAPTASATPTCPNKKWTAEIVDVVFTTATLTLWEDEAMSDRVVVAVS